MGSPNDAADAAKLQNFPQNEIALANLRDEAMQALAGGKPFSTTSIAAKEGTALHVSTSGPDGKPRGLMVVDGTIEDSTGLTAETVAGNYLVVKNGARGQSVEHDNFTITADYIDSHFHRDDKANISMERKTAAGGLIEKYEPAISTPKIVDGHVELDPNRQEKRVAKPAGSADNTHWENPGNPGNHRREADYIVHNAALAKTLGVSGDALSLNITFESGPDQQSGGGNMSYLGVLRTLDGEKVLGIINQEATLDKKGSLTMVQTSSRLPHHP